MNGWRCRARLYKGCKNLQEHKPKGRPFERGVPLVYGQMITIGPLAGEASMALVVRKRKSPRLLYETGALSGNWCRRPESNRHGQSPSVFETDMSTNSITSAVCAQIIKSKEASVKRLTLFNGAIFCGASGIGERPGCVLSGCGRRCGCRRPAPRNRDI